MKIGWRVFLLVLPLMMAGLSQAAEYERGKVTEIDRGRQIVEIDGKRYHCPRSVMRRTRKGDRVEYIVDRQYDDAVHRTAVTEIYSIE